MTAMINIIPIVLDDAGYAKFNCLGSEYCNPMPSCL